MKHTVETVQTENGDLIIPIPDEMLQALKWTSGDEITLSFDEHGNAILQRVTNG